MQGAGGGGGGGHVETTVGKFNGGGFKPLMNLSSHYLTLKTVSEKVHRGGVRRTDKPAVWVVSLDIALS